MASRIQSFCHVTFAFLPFAGVADLAHALVQLGGVLANGIRVAVIEPQGALIHVCKETGGSGGARDGEGGTRPARTADHVCRAAGTHTCTHIHARVCNRRQKHAEMVSELTCVCWLYVDMDVSVSNSGQPALRFCTRG